jgi:hypothetical protein
MALAVALALLGGLWLETRVLLARRRDGYFLVGIPLWQALVPVPRAPEGSGQTASVRWEVSDEAPNLVRWWADPKDRKAPTGLHGVVILAQGRRGIELEVRWAPPWTVLLAALWLAALGIARGEPFTVPIAAVMVLGTFVLYGERARRAAAELRWAFLSGSEPDPPGGV